MYDVGVSWRFTNAYNSVNATFPSKCVWVTQYESHGARTISTLQLYTYERYRAYVFRRSSGAWTPENEQESSRFCEDRPSTVLRIRKRFVDFLVFRRETRVLILILNNVQTACCIPIGIESWGRGLTGPSCSFAYAPDRVTIVVSRADCRTVFVNRAIRVHVSITWTSQFERIGRKRRRI